MSLNFTNLVAQGRAKAPGTLWTPEELEALLLLEKTCSLSRVVAADYIRNGIMTPEDYEKAQSVKFAPKTMVEASKETEDALKENGKKAIAEVEVSEVKTEEVETPVAAAEVEVKATSTGKKKTK